MPIDGAGAGPLIGFVLALALGALLVASAALKAASPVRTRDAMATFGVRRPPLQWAIAGAVVAAEAALGVAVAGGVPGAAPAAAGLMLAFAAALGLAIARGRAGRPCACLGPRSRVSGAGVARDLVLAGLFAALPFMEREAPGADGWIAGGLVAALAGLLVLAVMVLALAREVAELRLAVGPQMALELDGEGPELGEPTGLGAHLAVDGRAVLGVAVFTSEGCHMCRALAPAIDELERDPLLAVGRFDEHAHGAVWGALDIPGSPYAVVVAPDGRALAKGTFNSFAQLQGMLAVAERRREEDAVAGGR